MEITVRIYKQVLSIFTITTSTSNKTQKETFGTFIMNNNKLILCSFIYEIDWYGGLGELIRRKV
jgi:hypothetical protein